MSRVSKLLEYAIPLNKLSSKDKLKYGATSPTAKLAHKTYGNGSISVVVDGVNAKVFAYPNNNVSKVVVYNSESVVNLNRFLQDLNNIEDFGKIEPLLKSFKYSIIKY